jgi:Protein of unknown function (DUF1376)
MSFEWYHRRPRDFLQTVAKMSLEERGAYATIVDLIFLYDSPLEDDDNVIAGYLHCHVNKWRPIRARLIAAGLVFCAYALVEQLSPAWASPPLTRRLMI